MLPPGPKLPRLLQTAMMWTRPHTWATNNQRRYGDVFRVWAAPSGWLVYLADPADIKTVFAGDPAVYHAGEANSIMRGVIGDNSVLLLDEKLHRDRRKLMLPPFHRDAVRRQTELMAEIADSDVARWPVGREFAVAPRMAAITLEVILRTVIGADDPARLAALREALPKVTDMNLLDVSSMAKPELLRHLPWRGVRRRRAEADALLFAEIADRRADPNLAERTDVLAMLVRAADENGRAMSDRELRDQLITLLMAGHETTATALSWTFERLVRHPELLRRAVEAADGDSTADDDYLDAIIKESLRIRPVINEVARTLTQPVTIKGYDLPAGTLVMPAIGLVHASAEQYPDPERFDPDRMLGVTLPPTTWFPFGGGGRRCLGATFALVEMRVVLRQLLRGVELETTDAPAEPQRPKHVTLVPARGARIRVRARRPVRTPAAAQTP
ncbi:cytochrome P450 [Pseudonocardia spinosispora]|uniref:cytochrome P450 n=1 Tax=Pseudonocardia spinosispora TaxID=103441 RepID=UPI0012EC9B4F|nr:cytochrome P450 [Pseudonocardia spinosispora]